MNTVDVVVFDTETNGLDYETCDLLSIGWIKIHLNTDDMTFEVLDHNEYLIYDTNIHNTPTCLEINGITDEMREEIGQPLEDVFMLFSQLIQNSFVYAYNVKFDYNFMTKYCEDIFEGCKMLGDIMQNKGESVICSIQRIIWEYEHRFCKFPQLDDHLHSAYDDVWVELIILLHDHFGIDVYDLLVDVDEYMPEIPTGKFRHKSVDLLMETEPEYMKWFMFGKKNSEHEDYLRDYILENWDISLSADDTVLKHPNRYFYQNHCERLVQ